jgi:N-acetylglucosamine-6-phosphate deacetylase
VLRARGVAVALGHSNATYDEALAAADAGATLVTHVFNAMAPMHHRAPGLAGAALSDARLAPAVIGDGVHVHPAVLALVLATGHAVLVSDSVRTDAARRPDGSLGGSTVTLAEAVAVAVRAGVPLATALVAATARPAALIGRTDLGRLEPGARGDVVALDASFRVVRVASG